MAGMRKRMLWHMFGAIASLIFALGSASLFAGNSEVRASPAVWAIVTIVGLCGMLAYQSPTDQGWDGIKLLARKA
jgi:hypothetical protein